MSEPYVWKGVRVVSGDKVYRVTCTKTTSGCLRGNYKFPGNRKCCLPNMCPFAKLEDGNDIARDIMRDEAKQWV
jgi:hypothetical protein